MDTQKPDTKKQLFTFLIYFLTLAYGFSVTIIGPLIPSLISTLEIRVSAAGLLLTLQSLGGIIAILVSGLLLDRYNKKIIVGIVFLMYGASLFVSGFSATYTLVLIMFFILGIGTRIFDTAGNALIADLYPDSPGKHLGILHVFFSTGAFLGPIYARIVLSGSASWKLVFIIFGAICIGLTGVYTGVGRGHSSGPKFSAEPAGSGSSKIVLGSGFIWIFGIVSFLYFGHVYSLSTWLPVYLEVERGIASNLAGFALSLFWLGIIFGRFVCTRLVQSIEPVTLLKWGCLAGGLFLTAAFLASGTVLILALIILTGVSAGACIPLMITAVCTRFPNHTGLVSSFIFLTGNVAAMLFPYFIGLVSEQYSFRTGLFGTSFVLIIIFIVLSVLHKKVRYSGESD
jgi:fucose permease